MLIEKLNQFVNEEACPVHEQCIPGFVAGANTGWGWARNRVKQIIRQCKPAIPDHAVCFFRDGDKWCCTHADFINLQESPAGFGDSFEEALHELQAEGAKP